QKTVMASLIATARENGLLVLRSGANVIRIAPPLVISESEIDEGCDILAKSIETVRQTEKGAFHE
ncbi:MAG: aminotransferase class III-fold pyridoxal phosphate-dependent enzyme, partial [Spirochaetaceae bacterium]